VSGGGGQGGKGGGGELAELLGSRTVSTPLPSGETKARVV